MDDKSLNKLENILNQEFEEAEARLNFRITQLLNEKKLTEREAAILRNCTIESDNPWVNFLYDEDEDDGT